MLTISPDRMRIRTGHRAHMPRSSEPPPIAHVIYQDPSDPWSPQRSSAHTDSLHSTHRLGRLEPRTAQGTRQSAVRVRAQSAAWAGAPATRALELAVPEVPRRRPSNPNLREQGRRVRDECRARQAPSFERRLHVPARHQPVRWPRNQPLEVALQKAGGHASGMASVRRRRRVVAHRRGDLKMRDVLLVSIVVCVLT